MNDKRHNLRRLVRALKAVSILAREAGVTRFNELRELCLLDALDLERAPPRTPGDARDARGSIWELKTATQGNTCQIGRVVSGGSATTDATLRKLAESDFICLAWFMSHDPLAIAAAFTFPAKVIIDEARRQARNQTVANVSFSESWASKNGKKETIGGKK